MNVLDELRTGEKVSEGRFRIDQKRALEKLKQNRLAQPADWVKDVLRAAQASGAKHVEARTDADDVELSFDGRPFPAAVMKNLLAQALGTDDTHDSEPRYRLLALGVAGAMGVGLKRLFVQSGKVSLEVGPTGEVEVKETAPSERTVVKARKKLGLGVAAALLFGKKPERHNIYLGAAWLDPKVTLDGKVQPRATLEKEYHHGDGLAVYAKPYALDFSLVRLVVHGVSAGVRYWKLGGLQIEAVIKCDAFRSNASGSDVVDTDPNLTRALGICRKISLKLLEEHVLEPGPALREQLVKRLLHDDQLDGKARALMETMPLFLGPSGERHSVADLKGHAKHGRPLYTAARAYPKGSYPKHTVLLDRQAAECEALLPRGKREDVAAIVRRNQRAAENKLRWESLLPETATLPARSWLAVAPIITPKMKGEAGIAARGDGAFVRLLAQGRFLQEGEVPLLAPLRLRAVVDLQFPISEKLWAEIPNTKLWSAVVDEVQAATEAAIGVALEAKEPHPAAFEHARDLLLRRAGDKGAGLPRAVTQAPLFECLGGTRCSLDDLRGEQKWRYVTRPFDHPPLDGRRVLLLSSLPQKRLLEPYANDRFTDVTEQLERERDVRKRLAGPKQPAVLLRYVVAVPFVRGPMRGEVGISTDVSDKLDLALYRDGFELERTTQTPRYGPARAAVDHPALQPTPDWSKAVRDAAFDEVLKAVHETQRQLALPLLEKFPSFNTMPAAGKAWLLAFAKKELDGATGEPDVVARTVLESKLLDGPQGPVSLAELKARAKETGHLYLLPAWRSCEALQGEAAFSGDGDAELLVFLAAGIEPEDGMPAVERALQRAAFAKKPRHERRLRPGMPMYVALDDGRFRGAVALKDGWEPTASVSLLADGRLWASETLPSTMPLALELEVTVADPTQPPDDRLREQLASLVVRAQALVLDRALKAQAGRTLYGALEWRADKTVPEHLAKQLLAAKVFPCTDGVWRSAAQLDALGTVQYVTKKLEGTPRSGRPVVVALDEDVLAGLRRFAREEVTDALELELSARAAHEKRQPAKEIRFTGTALLKRPLWGAFEGEVAIAPAAEGRLELFFEKRPLCNVPGALPLPLAAAVNFDGLHPSPGLDGVAHDAAFQKVVDAVVEAAGDLGAELAERWDELQRHPSALESALRLCTLFSGQRGRRRRLHPLLDLPLLTGTDRAPMTVRSLVDANAKKGGKVLYADRPGVPLSGPRVWHSDRQLRAWLEPLGLELKDATAELEQAERVRARPKVREVSAPLESRWRERFEAGSVEGEVALPDAPTEVLTAELYQERALLERYTHTHVFGGDAAVNCDDLKANPTWSKAVRNATFRNVMLEIDKALERLLARRLQTRDLGWRAWAENAVKWAAGQAGPVADALPQLSLFETLAGEPVTVGAALAEYAKARRVAVARLGSGDAPQGRLVLRDSEETRALLEALRVTVKDVSDELLRQGELEAQRKARRISQLSWPGEALVRVKVAGPGIGGELALPKGDPNVEVTLAKQGVRVQALPRGLAPDVAGVVDIEGLLVNEEWTEARLAPPERELIEKHVDELVSALCRKVPSMPKDERAAARRHVLQWLKQAGVGQAANLDRLTGTSAELARAPVFETAGGEWVGLAVLAEEVRRRGKLAVFAKTLLKPDTGGVLGLWARSHDEAWLEALEPVLGLGALERVKDAAAWRERLSEEDPPPGSPEAWALGRLRRDVRLLRAGALGELSAEDIDDVRLKELGGEAPVHYDARRKVVLLDVKHEQVKRALAQGKLRRERLYVLLAAMYGAINRALARITDEHEEALALALATHLAENPQLLDSGD